MLLGVTENISERRKREWVTVKKYGFFRMQNCHR